MLRCKKVLPVVRLAFIYPSPFAVASPPTDLGAGLPATATSMSRGVRGDKELGGKFALAAEDRPVLKFVTQARAERRSLLSAALWGSGIGLGLGATYLAAGMAGHIADRAHAQRMAEAATIGYAGSHLEAQGEGLRVGLNRYSVRAGSDAATVAVRFDNDRGAARTRKRADLECMTDAVYYEARGESARGQAAVAQVVMNRVSHPAFPKTVCGVVFQGAGRSGCQFSFACDGSMKRRREAGAWERARDVAKRALIGAAGAQVGRATHFHTTAVSPVWAPSMLRVAQVGTHVFYKFSPYRVRMTAQASPHAGDLVLTSGPGGRVHDLQIAPALTEQVIEASLQPPAVAEADPVPAAKPTEAAQLVAPQAAQKAAAS